MILGDLNVCCGFVPKPKSIRAEAGGLIFIGPFLMGIVLVNMLGSTGFRILAKS